MAQRSPQELFHEAAQQGVLARSQPWWKIQLFMWEPVLFGTWDGVFTSCMINIFGVVLFLRTGWLVGNTGVLLGLLLVSFVILVALITVLSGIGVAEHGWMGSGGVYSMISSVLGGQMGGTVGLLYVFGQCVAGAMYLTGFAESISDLLGLGNIWAVRGISVAVLLALLGINLAGVKWIIRLQLLLLSLLAVSTLDFVVGSFTHLDPGSHYSPVRPRTHSIAKDRLKLNDPPASTSQFLVLKAYLAMPGFQHDPGFYFCTLVMCTNLKSPFLIYSVK